MANPIKREDLRWEAGLAAVSMAGVRPIVQAVVVVTAGAEDTYTIADIRTKRVVIVHFAAAATDIRFDLNAAAVATDFPIMPSVYFVVEVEEDDVLHFFNNNASDVNVYVMEIR